MSILRMDHFESRFNNLADLIHNILLMIFSQFFTLINGHKLYFGLRLTQSFEVASEDGFSVQSIFLTLL